jgi:hypothetical protein
MMIAKPRYMCSNGAASIGLRRHPIADDRMISVLSVTDADSGRQFVIEVTVDDLRGLLLDAKKLLTADARTVREWWEELANGDDNPPRAATLPRTTTETKC